MDKQDESYLDNLLQEYSKEPPNDDNRRKRAEKKGKKSDTDLMLDSLEEEFKSDDIDGLFLEEIQFDSTDEEAVSLTENPQSEEELSKEAEVEVSSEVSDEIEEKAFTEEVQIGKEEAEEELTDEVQDNVLSDLEENLGELAGDLFESEIGTEDLFSDFSGIEESGQLDEGFEETYEISESTHTQSSLEEEARKNKKDELLSKKKKSGFLKFFGKLFANVPLTEEEINAIPTPEQEMEVKKQRAEEAKLKKEEKKAKAEANKKQKAEEAKQKAAEKQAKKKAKEEAKKEAKKNAELKRLRAEAALPPEGKINKAGAVIVLLFFLLIGAVVIFGSGIIAYNNSIASASDKFYKKEYNAAYQKIRGIDVKEKDMEIRDKIHTVMFVNKQLNSYNNFYNMGNYANALDSLIKGLFRYDKYIAYATQIGIKSDLNYVRKQIMAELEDTYQMTERDALVLMGIIDKKEYSENVYKIAAKIKKKTKPAKTEKKEFVP